MDSIVTYAVYQNRNGTYETCPQSHVPNAYKHTVVMTTTDEAKADAQRDTLNSWQRDVSQLARWQRADAAQKRMYGVSYCADYLALISACFAKKWSGCK